MSWDEEKGGKEGEEVKIGRISRNPQMACCSICDPDLYFLRQGMLRCATAAETDWTEPTTQELNVETFDQKTTPMHACG